jgi:hypothetical protein
VHTLEPELRALRARGILDDAATARALARERREPFSIHLELRALLYAGVLLVMAAAGLYLARNLDRIGPLTIVLAVAAVAVACAVPAARARLAGRTMPFAADYLLLLGALLLSADLAYAERQFTLLGPAWSWHLLLLAVLHGCIAYAFRTSLVLAASVTALVGWFGVGTALGDPLHIRGSSPMLGLRALACAATLLLWREADRRLRPQTGFTELFDHFAANLAFWCAVAWCIDWPWLAAGLPLLAALSFASIRRALATGREAFLVYAIVYAALGVSVAAVPRIHGITAMLAFLLLVTGVAATALWQLRRRLREARP